MSVLKDYTDEVKRQLADGSIIIAPDDYPKLVVQAVLLYSNKIQREVVLDLPSDGSGEFAISALTGFDEELSGDVEIEYPISTSGSPNTLDRRSWRFYRKPAGKVIRLESKPAAGQQVRFTFAAKHSITEAASTIADAHFDAVCKLAAAEGCEQLARHYKQTSESGEVTIGGQAFFGTKDKAYESGAKLLRMQAYEVIGAGSGADAGAASVTKNFDQSDSRGRDWLTHGRRFR
ncbi:MAG: hypothetical protein AABN33_18430 [Acidobacteriota bacterium]